MSSLFSNTARSERQYATMLLPHLLMADDFVGLAALFKRLGLPWSASPPFNETEAIAELNPIRDVAKPNQLDWDEDAEPAQKAAVPDLFFRRGDTILVIEAKFFTHPSSSALAEQLREQEAAIRCALPSTVYGSCQFHYLALTVLPLDDVDEWPSGYSRMTWSNMLQTIEPVVEEHPSADKRYALYAIRNAIERSEKEAETSATEIGRESTIQALVANAPALLEAGCQYIGFLGGLRALAKTDLRTLETRGHYKYSDCQPNKNWIPLVKVVAKYLELKAEAHAKTMA